MYHRTEAVEALLAVEAADLQVDLQILGPTMAVAFQAETVEEALQEVVLVESQRAPEMETCANQVCVARIFSASTNSMEISGSLQTGVTG